MHCLALCDLYNLWAATQKNYLENQDEQWVHIWRCDSEPGFDLQMLKA